MTMTIAFSKAARVMMSRGLMSSFSRCRIALQTQKHPYYRSDHWDDMQKPEPGACHDVTSYLPAALKSCVCCMSFTDLLLLHGKLMPSFAAAPSV